MAKIVVMLITGKENINSEMVAFNFAINSVKNAKAAVEFLFLGRGVEAAVKGQKSSPQFEEQINQMKALGIPVKICKVSMQGEGLTEEDVFPGMEQVMGGVEVNSKI
ncbi:MAG: DsrE family protein, partial [Nitrososphaerota archaeon]|nr:DsrE family protein [Nitrososphaerota archaeon]